MSNDTIDITHACKVIHRRTVLDDINLHLVRGRVYGFQGENGSGKTMLLRAVAGLIHLSSGNITVFGKTIGKDCTFAPNMGCMLGSEMWDEYTGYENLQFLAAVKGVIGHDQIYSALARVGLDPADDRPYQKYSLGMRQRLDLAQAIMENPELLMLDEPSNGLDVQGLDLLCNAIETEQARGATILVVAHNSPEIINLCDAVITIHAGKIEGVTS